MPSLAACPLAEGSNLAVKSFAASKPGSGGGPIQNAKAQSAVRQAYGKGKGVAAKSPAKKPGMSGDDRKPRKALAGKKK